MPTQKRRVTVFAARGAHLRGGGDRDQRLKRRPPTRNDDREAHTLHRYRTQRAAGQPQAHGAIPPGKRYRSHRRGDLPWGRQGAVEIQGLELRLSDWRRFGRCSRATRKPQVNGKGSTEQRLKRLKVCIYDAHARAGMSS